MLAPYSTMRTIGCEDSSRYSDSSCSRERARTTSVTLSQAPRDDARNSMLEGSKSGTRALTTLATDRKSTRLNSSH